MGLPYCCSALLLLPSGHPHSPESILGIRQVKCQGGCPWRKQQMEPGGRKRSLVICFATMTHAFLSLSDCLNNMDIFCCSQSDIGVMVRPERFSDDGSSVVISLCRLGNGNSCGEDTSKFTGRLTPVILSTKSCPSSTESDPFIFILRFSRDKPCPWPILEVP